MGLFRSSKAVVVNIGGEPFKCLVCEGDRFLRRPVQLNTAGATLFGFDWANEEATGLVCVLCGYVHEFIGNSLDVNEVDDDNGARL